MDTSHSEVAGLLTPRLLMRDFSADDAPRMSEIVGEREAWPNVLRKQRRPARWPSYVAAAAQYALAVPFSLRPHLILAVTLRESNELIGMCSLTNAALNSRRAYIGWHFSTKHSGFGYATEAGKELLRYGFEERKVACVYADCFETNAANRRVLSKLGMHPAPRLSILKWLLALKYRELRPIVRYSIENQFQTGSALAAYELAEGE